MVVSGKWQDVPPEEGEGHGGEVPEGVGVEDPVDGGEVEHLQGGSGEGGEHHLQEDGGGDEEHPQHPGEDVPAVSPAQGSHATRRRGRPDNILSSQNVVKFGT